MDEYKFVNSSTPPACVKAYTLPPAYPDQINFQPPTLPQNWGDKGVEGKQKLATQMTTCIKPDTPINVYTRFCLNTAKSKFSLESPVAD